MTKERKTESLKDLVDEFGLSLDPITINRTMICLGLLEERHYLSTTGSGESKKYKVITEKGITFGENAFAHHEIKTEPRYYKSTFPLLAKVIVDHLQQEIEGISIEGEE